MDFDDLALLGAGAGGRAVGGFAEVDALRRKVRVGVRRDSGVHTVDHSIIHLQSYGSGRQQYYGTQKS